MDDGKQSGHSSSSRATASPEGFRPIVDARPDDAPWQTLRWPPPAGTLLRGAVVELVPIDPQRDATELFAALDFDAVWRHLLARPANPADYAAALTEALGAGRFPWLVRLVRDSAGLTAGSVVGTSSYLDITVADTRLEIGFTAYTPAVWGTAVNPETKLLLLGHAFEQLRAGRVQLKTDVRNVRSQRAIDRLGARYEGTLRRYQRRTDGTVRDTAMFSVTAEDWPAVEARLRKRLA